MDSPFVTLAEASAWLCTPIKTLRFWISQGRLPSYKPGRKVLVKRVDLVALVEASKQ